MGARQREEVAGAGTLGAAAPDLEVTPPAPQDAPSVDDRGRPALPLIDGVAIERLAPLVDHRGSLTEVVNFAHDFWAEPVVHCYAFTVKPGRIKGWGMHRLQDDRYAVLGAELRVVLYDGRVGSPTHERFNQSHFGPAAPGLLRIPAGVWHADQNTGAALATVLNFPTRAYDRRDPDKYRIDPHSGEIPFDWTLRDG